MIIVVGPIPNSENGNKYIFTAICDLTKFLVAVPTVDCTSLTAAECLLENIICRYNFPSRLISDNSSNFISKVIVISIFGQHCLARRKIVSTANTVDIDRLVILILMTNSPNLILIKLGRCDSSRCHKTAEMCSVKRFMAARLKLHHCLFRKP